MKPCHLTEKQYHELLRLSGLYRKQSDRCADSKAYLAACVMIGSALESDLIAFCHCYSNEIPTDIIPQRKGKPKHLLNWTFFELLRVAKRCAWLPAGLQLEEDWNQRRAKIGDWAEVVRQIRNLVHPGCYVSDYSRQRVTKTRMELCSDVLNTAQHHLLQKLHKSLEAAVMKLEKKRKTNVSSTRRGSRGR